MNLTALTPRAVTPHPCSRRTGAGWCSCAGCQAKISTGAGEVDAEELWQVRTDGKEPTRLVAPKEAEDMLTDQPGGLAGFTARPLNSLIMFPMRCFVWALSLLCLFVSAAHAKPASELPRAELVNIMVGDYIIVGKKPDSNVTYIGRLSFRARGEKLAFTRTVDGRTVRGTATLEMTVIGDPAPVLRMRFVQDNRRLEGTFQWMFDLDNYARFTGYVYRQDGSTIKAAGLEMLFPLQPSIRD